MSFDKTTPNPYASPAQGYMPPAPAPGTRRSGWMTFFCIIAIVLGSLGAANAVMGTASLVFASFLQQGMQGPPPPGLSQEFVDLQNKMNAEMLAVTHRYFYFLLPTQLILAVIATGLLIAGIRALNMSRSGVWLLSTMFLVTSIYEVARLVLTLLHQMEVGQVTQKYLGPLMEKMPQGGKGVPPGFGNMMSTMISVGIGVGICFTVGWAVIKLAIYLSGWVYLNKPQVQAQLQD
jgi:hypothetical protein